VEIVDVDIPNVPEEIGSTHYVMNHTRPVNGSVVAFDNSYLNALWLHEP